MKFFVYNILFTLLFCSFSFADNFNDDLQQIDSFLTTLKIYQADLLFADKMSEFYSRIEELKKFNSIDTRKQYKKAYTDLIGDLQSLVASAQNTQNFLVRTLHIRQGAIQVGAEDFAPELFLKAESSLKKAAKYHLIRKINNAEKKVREAENQYQKAEIQSIRNNLIGQIRIVIQEALDLNADEIAPMSFTNTQKLLNEVVTLIGKTNVEDYSLSQKSQSLIHSANHLLHIVQTIYPLYHTQKNTETFMVNLEKQITFLAKEMNYYPSLNQEIDKTFSDLQKVAKSINEENTRLLERNRHLESDKRELERELLRYKSLAKQKQLLQNKISRARTILKDRVVENGQILKLYIDSLVFENDYYTLSTNHIIKLTKLIDALSEFSEYPITLKYIQSSTDSSAYNQSLAKKRGLAIKIFLKKHLFLKKEQLKTIGISNNISQSNVNKPSYLEVTLDLQTYWDFRNRINQE